MSLTIRWRRVLTIAGIVLVSLVAAPTTSPALTTTTSTDADWPTPCPTAHMCLFEHPHMGGDMFAIPEGESAWFSPPMMTGAFVNNTKLTYCVDSGLVRAVIRPGGVVRLAERLPVDRVRPC